MCARCHSWARTALQRRTEADWRKQIDSHSVSSTIEYQALGRDRNWWTSRPRSLPRSSPIVPLQDAGMGCLEGARRAGPVGESRMVGHDPGHGDYQGKVTIASQGQDKYAYKLRFAYADGTKMDGTGSGIVYTGYEWRSRTTVGDQASLQVFEVSEDGNRMTGRDFAEDASALGGPVTVVREQSSQILRSSRPI